jgi:fluoroacetyl-CoA thioesterase
VFATGFLVGLLEWACVEAINPHLDWPAEQSVGIRVDVTHEAPTPPGMEVLVKAEVLAVAGRRISFRVEANDGIDTISRGTHDRAVIDAQSFGEKAALKLDRAGAQT